MDKNTVYFKDARGKVRSTRENLTAEQAACAAAEDDHVVSFEIKSQQATRTFDYSPLDDGCPAPVGDIRDWVENSDEEAR